jgi:integrase
MCDENGKRDVAEDSVMTWHGFRHSASTNNQQAGMPVALSMKLLGHKNLSTHQRYMEGHLNLADAGAALGRVMSGDVA